MKIGIIQVKVSSNIKANLSFVAKHIQSCIKEHAEIIVLNEMWNAPYDNEQILLSYKTHDKCYQLLQEESRKHQIIIIGGTIARKENNKIYNTCHIFENGKHICQYDKMHLFEVNIEGHKLYSESEVFTPGNSIKTFDTKYGRFGILVCYDIRFPEETRLLAMKQAKVIFCPAAFNESAGKAHWQPLLQTRAMENQVFIVGANPQHYVYKQFKSYGHSLICDPFGKVLIDANQNDYIVYDIDLAMIDKIRKRMPFWKIRRKDIYDLVEKEPKQ
ncbi:nitrilase-related carbon-nitrogen hydrolase [Faecalitalea cylindroides]|uniref:nitrilase-related carbon-nitrogen hydrolase n=1 Tax=Faecalitalea cylindroides TaxID=39483 RepID=UPI0024907763|nr:nitrilase-related carbon-nitrogen hydrolase [Faecalitalea cylindroides]